MKKNRVITEVERTMEVIGSDFVTIEKCLEEIGAKVDDIAYNDETNTTYSHLNRDLDIAIEYTVRLHEHLVHIRSLKSVAWLDDNKEAE